MGDASLDTRPRTRGGIMGSIGKPKTLGSTALVLVLFAAPVAANNVSHWDGLAALEFSQCYVHTTLGNAAPCQDDLLVVGDGCSLLCASAIPGEPPFGAGGYTSHSTIDNQLGWRFAGLSGYSSGDLGAGTSATVEAERISAEALMLTGTIETFSYQPVPTPVELAVFRFDGDPTIFDGMEIRSVHDLVADGIILGSDILFVHVYHGDHGPVAEEIEVVGVPDEEIVLFGAAKGFIPIPAVSSWGAVLLAALFLGLAAWVLARRRSLS
jgi:hypothetical protein